MLKYIQLFDIVTCYSSLEALGCLHARACKLHHSLGIGELNLKLSQYGRGRMEKLCLWIHSLSYSFFQSCCGTGMTMPVVPQIAQLTTILLYVYCTNRYVLQIGMGQLFSCLSLIHKFLLSGFFVSEGTLQMYVSLLVCKSYCTKIIGHFLLKNRKITPLMTWQAAVASIVLPARVVLS